MRANVFDTFFHKRIYSFRQYDSMDCSPTCLKIIAKYYNKDIEIETIRKWSGIARDGVSLYGLDAAAKRLEFETNPVLISAHDLVHYFEAPCIIHWNQKHFMVCYKISSNHFSPVFHIIDPAQGRCKFSMNEFRRFFENREGKGVVLFLTPSESFKQESTQKNKPVWSSSRKFQNEVQ
ncbi:cysteine peptidase family C39 domain-containing protein [Hallella colorans]|uniref:Peptidase C39-like protein n=1 Tax=Hallella colorans TaxID=1703337 RepID=A0A2U0TX46_9BACT|nr:cysteine peptidase family C39 domain-containing protein [Hallella colorans]PVX48172.1 peptidase C39-like protein [Hallella colorans]